MGSLGSPARGITLETAIRDPVDAIDEHFHLINQRRPRAQQHDLEPVGIRHIGKRHGQHAGGLNRRPWSLGGLVAVDPIAGLLVVGPRVRQLEAEAIAKLRRPNLRLRLAEYLE